MVQKTRIRVVPHFMRLHEWIALEEGAYQSEGLEPELLTDLMHDVSSHGRDAYFERPQDKPFLAGAIEVANSACEWGSVCNAGAGMGKFVADLYGIARFAIFARPDSGLTRLAELAGVSVGVGLMAGSHFTTLRTLEGVLPREQVTVENIGGPGRRLQALLDGEVKVANLLDPEIAIAEARGLTKLAQGEFRTLFWVSPGIPADALGAYFRTLRRADEDAVDAAVRGRIGPVPVLPRHGAEEARTGPFLLAADALKSGAALAQTVAFYTRARQSEELRFGLGQRFAAGVPCDRFLSSTLSNYDA